MIDTRARVACCFLAVFPRLTNAELSAASIQTVEGWDSVASVTLVALIEEEFDIQIEPEAVENMMSYRSVVDYLQGMADKN